MADGLIDHPERIALAKEIHNRPHPELIAPKRISHVARLSGEASAAMERAHLATLCERYGAPPPPDDALHYNVALGRFRLLWERHTEFSTYTVIAEGGSERPFERAALELLPTVWLEAVAGTTVAACHLVLLAAAQPEPSPDELAAMFEGYPVYGSRVMGARAEVRSALRIHGDGFGRYLVRDAGLSAGQGGRLVQRLWELETYLAMALLTLPVARASRPTIAEAEAGLARLAAATATASDLPAERALLRDLFAVAGTIERQIAATGYRFGAARAYEAIVAARIAELREERLDGLQPIGQFVARRFRPAMDTCHSVEGRQESLSRRIARTADLLRTRVDLELQAQNQELLASMNRRARLQLRLQQMVEGLSVVAISYYALGLLGYPLKGLFGLLPGLSVEAVLALLAPAVVLLTWLALRRMKRRLHRAD